MRDTTLHSLAPSARLKEELILAALSCASTKEFTLQSEDVLFIYTDGITDARNPDGKMFERENLKESLLRHAKKRSEMVRDGLLADLEQFTHGYPADDDRTLVVFRKR